MSVIEIAFVPKARGIGNSLAMLDALKACAKKIGFAEMFAPVRPSQKHLQPRTPMRDYINLERADGLPMDAWLRTHIRVGGSVEDRSLFHDDRWHTRRVVTMDRGVRESR